MSKKPYRKEKHLRNVKILHLYVNSELTVNAIGKLYNISGSQITTIAQQNGAEPRSSKYVRAIDNIKINQPAIIFDDENCTIISTKKENYCKKRQRILMLAYRRNFQLHTYHFNSKLYVWRIE